LGKVQVLARYAPNGSVWLCCTLRNVEFWTKVKAKGNPGAQDDEGGHLRGLKWYILPMNTTTKNITMSGGKQGKKKN
jgi:hypothetical protein